MIEDVIAGLMIIQAYLPQSLVYAEHDIIYSQLTTEDISNAAKLDELGWFFDEEYECWAKFV